MDRRQFTAGTASALLGLGVRNKLAMASALATTPLVRPGDIRLKEYLGIYDFPEEVLTYPLAFDTPVRIADLRLVAKGRREPMVFQLSDVQQQGGLLKSANLHFRADLKANQEKSFSLVSDGGIAQAQAQPIALEALSGDRAALHANQLHILVPAGRNRTLHVPVADAPAPLLAIAREPGKWAGAGKLEGPPDLVVETLDAHLVESGPLFARYAVTYTFSGNRSYAVELKIQTNEAHVEIDELSNGFGPADRLAFRFSMKDGIDPNGRLLMANGGYSTGGLQQGASGAYDQGANPAGLLPIKLGLYTPNSINLPRAIAFWNDQGANAILFSLCRLPDWKTSQRALWSSSSLPDNLEFYADKTTGDKYVRAAVVGPARFWAIALIPRDQMIVRGVTQGQISQAVRPPEARWLAVSSAEGMLAYGGGPEVRLLLKLNDFSLNRYKDCIFEFPENARTTAFTLPNAIPEEMTGPDYLKAYRRNIAYLGQVGWDFSGDLGPNHWGWSNEPASVNYAHNVARWNEQDHMQARSWLVFNAYLLELDTAMPHSSMLGGHPNFFAEFKEILGIAAGLFPLHPAAPRWRDTYQGFFAEYLDKYVRKGDATTGALAGRFTESIACYNYASMEAVGMAAAGFKQFDGTQLLDRPGVRDWARWDMECRLPFRLDGARVVPPQGAHAAMSLLGPGGRWHNVAYAFAQQLKESAPQLGNEWLWTITAGAEGTRPAALASAVFADYGPVLRYDFGGPNEAYLQMQQLNGQGYRWSGTSNGALYYAAKGKVWSWNLMETNGDGFDITKLPVFQVGKASLGASPADSVLHNFGFAQFYRAQANTQKGTPAYQSRAVIMVRGDYLAVYDQAQSADSGTFNWSNVANGLLWEIFSDIGFQQVAHSLTNDQRFTLNLGHDQLRDVDFPKGNFSLRATGQFLPPVAGSYKFRTTWNSPALDVPAGDTVRLYFDDQKVFDSMGGPAAAQVTLEARPYRVRCEYIHTSSKPASLVLSWNLPDRPNFGQIENEFYHTVYPMPFIEQVKGGAGDQLHIVAPEKVAVEKLSPTVARVGKDEFVILSADATTVDQAGLTFTGKTAYARPGELALFEGTHLALGGLGLSRDEGDFGASLKQMSPTSLEGHVAGRSGGALQVHLPPGFATTGLKATFDGHDTPVTAHNGAITLPIVIQQSDGTSAFSIQAT
jgi:hypothetical protein